MYSLSRETQRCSSNSRETRSGVRNYKATLTPPPFIEVPVSSKESKLSCIVCCCSDSVIIFVFHLTIIPVDSFDTNIPT